MMSLSANQKLRKNTLTIIRNMKNLTKKQKQKMDEFEKELKELFIKYGAVMEHAYVKMYNINWEFT